MIQSSHARTQYNESCLTSELSDILGMFTGSSHQQPTNSTFSTFITQYLNKVASGIITLAEDLAILGFPHIMVGNIPALSITPLFDGLDEADINLRGRVDLAVQMVNRGIVAGVNQLTLDYPLANFLILDFNKLMTQVLDDFSFKNKTSACLVTSPPTSLFRLNAVMVSLCDDPDGYFYWDSIHPSARGHALLADVVDVFLHDAELLT